MIEHDRQAKRKALAVFFLHSFHGNASLILLCTAGNISQADAMMPFIFLGGTGKFALLIPDQFSRKIIFYFDKEQLALVIGAQFHTGGRRYFSACFQGIFEAIVEDDADIVNIIGCICGIMKIGRKFNCR